MSPTTTRTPLHRPLLRNLLLSVKLKALPDPSTPRSHPTPARPRAPPSPPSPQPNKAASDLQPPQPSFPLLDLPILMASATFTSVAADPLCPVCHTPLPFATTCLACNVSPMGLPRLLPSPSLQQAPVVTRAPQPPTPSEATVAALLSPLVLVTPTTTPLSVDDTLSSSTMDVVVRIRPPPTHTINAPSADEDDPRFVQDLLARERVARCVHAFLASSVSNWHDHVDTEAEVTPRLVLIDELDLLVDGERWDHGVVCLYTDRLVILNGPMDAIVGQVRIGAHLTQVLHHSPNRLTLHMCIATLPELLLASLHRLVVHKWEHALACLMQRQPLQLPPLAQLSTTAWALVQRACAQLSIALPEEVLAFAAMLDNPPATGIPAQVWQPMIPAPNPLPVVVVAVVLLINHTDTSHVDHGSKIRTVLAKMLIALNPGDLFGVVVVGRNGAGEPAATGLYTGCAPANWPHWDEVLGDITGRANHLDGDPLFASPADELAAGLDCAARLVLTLPQSLLSLELVVKKLVVVHTAGDGPSPATVPEFSAAQQLVQTFHFLCAVACVGSSDPRVLRGLVQLATSSPGACAYVGAVKVQEYALLDTWILDVSDTVASFRHAFTPMMQVELKLLLPQHVRVVGVESAGRLVPCDVETASVRVWDLARELDILVVFRFAVETLAAVADGIVSVTNPEIDLVRFQHRHNGRVSQPCIASTACSFPEPHPYRVYLPSHTGLTPEVAPASATSDEFVDAEMDVEDQTSPLLLASLSSVVCLKSVQSRLVDLLHELVSGEMDEAAIARLAAAAEDSPLPIAEQLTAIASSADPTLAARACEHLLLSLTLQ